jgi:putative membrane protein
MKNTLLLCAVAFAGVLQAFSNGNAPGSTDDRAVLTTSMVAAVGAAHSEPAMSDSDFAKEAAMGGMTEVALGKLAADKGQDPKVRDFGKMMVTDHTKANDELKGIARSKHIQLPVRLDDKHRKMSDELGKLSGKEFDTAYVKAMVEDHKEDLELFKSEATHGTDAELKAFAAKAAAVIQKHLTKIQEIHDGMK